MQGEEVIAQVFESGWLKTWQEPIIPLLDIDLDTGETDCINIAMQYTDQVLLVMDERAERSVAKEKGLKVIGTAAIIGIVKQQGLGILHCPAYTFISITTSFPKSFIGNLLCIMDSC